MRPLKINISIMFFKREHGEVPGLTAQWLGMNSGTYEMVKETAYQSICGLWHWVEHRE
jgi:hypothetical protein